MNKNQIKKYKKKYILKKFLCVFIFLIYLFYNSDYQNQLLLILKNYEAKINFKTTKKDNLKIFDSTTNINLSDQFFQLKEVVEQINKNKINNVNTIFGEGGNVGNALRILNNLIIACETIKCKNIISPNGLEKIIKRPIKDVNFNITIFPYKYKELINIDIYLKKPTIFNFKYKMKYKDIRLSLIRDEVLNNIPKYNANPDDLYINIRSGDIFINKINIYYSQPPLCFYQKIIEDNKNKFKNYYILSNGHENPVVDELLKLYPKIKYIHGSIEDDISVIVYSYNLVMPVSTFPIYLIWLNNNIINLYVYNIIRYDFKKSNCTIHSMIPSHIYRKLMQYKWRNTRKQLQLMLKEDCINSKIISRFIK